MAACTRCYTVELYTFNSVNPELESARSQPLNLQCDMLVKKCALIVPLHCGCGEMVPSYLCQLRVCEAGNLLTYYHIMCARFIA